MIHQSPDSTWEDIYCPCDRHPDDIAMPITPAEIHNDASLAKQRAREHGTPYGS
jgi:hypothetical protein